MHLRFSSQSLPVLSIITVCTIYTSGNQRALADTLVGVAFIVFVAITVYHGWKQLTDSRWWRLTLKPKWQKYFDTKQKEESPKPQENDEECRTSQTVTSTTIELREPVLDFC